CGILPDQYDEAVAAETQHFAIAFGANRRRPRLTCEERHLTDRIADSPRRQAGFSSLSRSDSVDAEGPAADDVQCVALLPLPAQLGAVRHRDRIEVGGDLRERDAVEPGEHLNLTEESGALHQGRAAHRITPRRNSTAVCTAHLSPPLPLIMLPPLPHSRHIARMDGGGRHPSAPSPTALDPLRGLPAHGASTRSTHPTHAAT